jgi:CBS domain-containing protein
MSHPFFDGRAGARLRQDVPRVSPGLPPVREEEDPMSTIRSRVVRHVVSLEGTATCAEAARLMSERGVGSVAVRQGERLVGLVTERDLVASLAAGADPGRTPLARLVRPNVPAVGAQTTADECAALMRCYRTRHLAVKEDGEMVGVISMLDLVDLVVEDKQADIDQLEAYIRGGRARELSRPIETLFHHAPVAG